ncbi:mobilization protein [Legionella bozemanae]|nr:mobilization protein [Legionella bozemanae]
MTDNKMSEKQSRLDALKKRKEQLNAQIQKLESLEKARERKRDTRRKILIGSYFIDKANQAGTLFDLYQQMNHYIKRNADRELFHLELVHEEKSVPETESME